MGAGFTIDGRHMTEERFGSEVLDVAAPDVSRASSVVAKIIDRHHSERANRGKGPDFRTAQIVAFVPD
jgi:hypothetical protein